MRIGIIGCGLIGQKRAAAAQGHEVVIVSDLDRGRAESLADRAGARASTRWQDVIEANVDAVIVATAHDSLASLGYAAVEAGKHVLIEKPAARTAEELLPVATAAELTKRIVKVGFNHRFHPSFIKARDLVDQGALGPLYYIRGRYGHGGRPGMEQEWRSIKARSGGGELIDQGVHLIDLSCWFLGDLALAYAATPTYFWNVAVDDNCFLALRGKAGEIAWLHATWTEWKNMFSFEITGREGKIVIDGLGGSYGTERITFYRMLPQMGPPETTSWEFSFPDRSWNLEFEEFAAAIEEGRQPQGNVYDALAVLKIVDRAYLGAYE